MLGAGGPPRGGAHGDGGSRGARGGELSGRICTSRGGGGSRFPWSAGGSLASALRSPCALSEAPTREQVLGPQDTLGPHLVWDRHQVKRRDKGRRSRAGSCGFCVFLNNSFVKIAFTHHRTHPYEVYNLVAFTIFTERCNRHL